MGQADVPIELIIVDNGSEDGSLAELRDRFPHARFIEMGYNSGFTGGMNAGIAAASGEYVLLENADLLLADNYCAGAVATMQKEPQVGAVGGKVYRLANGQRTTELDACGYTLSRTFRTRLLEPDAERDVLGVSGSCPVFRVAALSTIRAPVGYVLDPWYFAYSEDVDLMLRLNLAGWRVRYLPHLLAWHVRSGSSVPASRFYEKPDHYQVHHFKNRIATIVKCLPTRLLLRMALPLLFTELALPAYLVWHRPASLTNWLHGWSAVRGELSRLLRDRCGIHSGGGPANTARVQSLLATGR